MKKYFFVAKNSLSTYFAFRLNFLLWRIRVLVSFFISYFLWVSVLTGRNTVFNYSKTQMLTYILMTVFINGIVLSTQTGRIADEINYGLLSNFLIRPVNYLVYNIAVDLSDKLLNTTFSLVELGIFIYLLHPPLFLQFNPVILLEFAVCLFFAAVLYFEIGTVLSFIGFWSYDTWAPRFIFFILVAFLAGTYFPLDILPKPVYLLISVTPFPYLMFFPLKLYMGSLSGQYIIRGLLIELGWIFFLYFSLLKIWNKGLKIYTAEGQ